MYLGNFVPCRFNTAMPAHRSSFISCVVMHGPLTYTPAASLSRDCERRHAPSACSVGMFRVGVLRVGMLRVGMLHVGMLRRHAPSVCSAGMLRRHALRRHVPSACSVGMLRVGMLRRHAPRRHAPLECSLGTTCRLTRSVTYANLNSRARSGAMYKSIIAMYSMGRYVSQSYSCMTMAGVKQLQPCTTPGDM